MALVLNPGRGNTKPGDLWALARDDRRRGGDHPPCVVFHYAGGRSGQHAETFLTGFDGILQVDFYAGYKRWIRTSRKGGDPITVAQCWADARRTLREVYNSDGSESAADGLRKIADLYLIETEIKDMCPGNRLATLSWSRPSAIGWLRSALVSLENPASEKNSLTSPTIGRVCKYS